MGMHVPTLVLTAMLSCAVVSTAPAGEASIAYCANNDKVAVGKGPNLDMADAVAKILCQGTDAGTCCQVVMNTELLGCVAFAGKNPQENFGIGDDEQAAAGMAVINCQADCLGYNDPGKTPDQGCAANCDVRASACRQ